METRSRFLELRARGWSLKRIAGEIGVSKPTLIAWQRQVRHEIQDLKSVELEAIQEKILASHEEELGRLAAQLNRVEAILAKRNLEVLSTEFLFCMAGSLRTQIKKQCLALAFSAPSSAAETTAHAPGREEQP